MALAALRDKMRPLSFDANRATLMRHTDPDAIRAREQRDRIIEAIKLLEQAAKQRAARRRAKLLKTSRVKL